MFIEGLKHLTQFLIFFDDLRIRNILHFGSFQQMIKTETNSDVDLLIITEDKTTINEVLEVCEHLKLLSTMKLDIIVTSQEHLEQVSPLFAYSNIMSSITNSHYNFYGTPKLPNFDLSLYRFTQIRILLKHLLNQSIESKGFLKALCFLLNDQNQKIYEYDNHFKGHVFFSLYEEKEYSLFVRALFEYCDSFIERNIHGLSLEKIDEKFNYCPSLELDFNKSHRENFLENYRSKKEIILNQYS